MDTHDREPSVSSSLFSAYVNVGGHESGVDRQMNTEQPASGQAEPAAEAAPGDAEAVGGCSESEENNTPVEETKETEEEAAKRKAHEEAEAKRKTEWEAKQAEKKAAVQAQLDKIAAMNNEELVTACIKRVSTDTEKLTRRNMKECVSEYIQTRCLEDSELARMVMHLGKSMIHCFQYINRKAREYIEQEMKDNDIAPRDTNGVYGSDVPDDLCYQWGEEYFRDPDAKEDHRDEEKFVPRPYPGGRNKSKAKEKKKAAAKDTRKSKETSAPAAASGQISLMEMAS